MFTFTLNNVSSMVISAFYPIESSLITTIQEYDSITPIEWSSQFSEQLSLQILFLAQLQ